MAFLPHLKITKRKKPEKKCPMAKKVSTKIAYFYAFLARQFIHDF